MRIGIALTLVIACPTAAMAQYALQLRPSPYRILSGWEQKVNAPAQAAPMPKFAGPAVAASNRAPAVREAVQRSGGKDPVNGTGIYSGQAPHY